MSVDWLMYPSHLYHAYFGIGGEWQPTDPDSEVKLIQTELVSLRVQRRKQAQAVFNSALAKHAQIARQTSTDAMNEINDRRVRLQRLDDEIATRYRRMQYLSIYQSRQMLLIGLFVILLLLYVLLGGAKVYQVQAAEAERIRIANLP
jgi:hypothetical protein